MTICYLNGIIMHNKLQRLKKRQPAATALQSGFGVLNFDKHLQGRNKCNNFEHINIPLPGC